MEKEVKEIEMSPIAKVVLTIACATIFPMIYFVGKFITELVQ